MEFLASRNFSLACAFINGIWSLGSFASGELAWGIIGAGLCVLCTRNYLNAE